MFGLKLLTLLFVGVFGYFTWAELVPQVAGWLYRHYRYDYAVAENWLTAGVVIIALATLWGTFTVIGHESRGEITNFGRRLIGRVIGGGLSIIGVVIMAAGLYGAALIALHVWGLVTGSTSGPPDFDKLRAQWHGIYAGLPGFWQGAVVLAWIGLAARYGMAVAALLRTLIGKGAKQWEQAWTGLGFGKGGSAKFATIWSDWALPFRRGGVLLGGSMFNHHWWIGTNDDRGLLTIGATRAGKGRSSIIPNLILWPDSALVIDPKGENAAVTARRRGHGGGRVKEYLGQDVYVVDPFRIVRGAKDVCFNPLAYIDVESEDVREEILLIADGIIPPTAGKDPHWEEVAQMILAGIIAHELTCAKDGRMPTLIDVRGHLKKGMRHFQKLFAEMAENMEAGGLAAAAAAVVNQVGPNERGSFFSTLMRNTAWLDSKAMEQLFGGESDFDLGQLKHKPMTVYLVLPQKLLSIHSRFLRLFVTMALGGAATGGKGKHQILFVLDEFFALGFLSAAETGSAALSGFGVRMWPIVQNVSQIHKLYGENWETFFSGAGAVQVFGVNDRPTSEYLVWKLARHIVNREGLQKEVEQLREVNEVGRDVSREMNRAYIFRAGEVPMMVRRLKYDEVFPRSWYSPHPDHEPPEKIDKDDDSALPRGPMHSMNEALELATMQGAEKAGEDFAARMNAAWDSQREELLEEAAAQTETDIQTEVEGDSEDGGADDIEEEVKQGAKKRRRKKRETAAAGEPDSPPVPPITDEPTGFDMLDRLVGLENVKGEVRRMAATEKANRQRRKQGLKPLTVSRHMVFSGNPGTGKTTVAKILGEIFRETGALKSGHVVVTERGDLIGEYIGSTAKLMRKKCEEALDGILFIDEAYGVVKKESGKDYGAEAIEALMTFMEDNRERIVVIAAGYSDEMEKFVKFNPGLESRFRKRIEFEDFSADEMAEIFRRRCADEGLELDYEARQKIDALMLATHACRGERFANGRTVRNLFEDALDNYGMRISAQRNPGVADLTQLKAEDIPEAPRAE